MYRDIRKGGDVGHVVWVGDHIGTVSCENKRGASGDGVGGASSGVGDGEREAGVGSNDQGSGGCLVEAPVADAVRCGAV